MADVVLDPEGRQYEKLRKQLVDNFESWLTDQGITDDGTISSDAELLIDWCSNYSTGEISRIGVGDLQEFLLEWCPRKVSAPPSFAGPLCSSLESFVAFLAATDRLRGGQAMANRLTGYLSSNVDQVEAAMGDSSKFGMAKSLFAGSDPSEMFSADSIEELQQLAEERMAAHNALSLEERRAATDQFFTPEPVELPFSYFPPTDEEIAESATTAPLLMIFDQLREYLGDNGRTLTTNGNVKLADARALVELLETGDRIDEQIGNRTFKTQSSRELVHLSRLIDWAKAAGAVRVEKGRLKPVKRWASRPATDRVERCWQHLLAVGPLFDLRADMGLLNQVDDVTETGVLHWLVRILPSGERADFDTILQSIREAVADETADWDDTWSTSTEHFVVRDTEDCLQTLETAGVIAWRDSQQVDDKYGDLRRHGGTIMLTPVGRRLVAQLTPELGYRLHAVPELSQLTAAELIKQINSSPAAVSEIIDRWQPDLPADQRAASLAAVMTAEETTATERMIIVSLLYELPTAAVEPAIRTWLDGPAAGYAVAYLVERGLAELDDFDRSISVGPLVDALALLLDTPDELLEQWQHVVDNGVDPTQLLEDIWRHEVAETEPVLESLGHIIPDPRLAKLARKSLFKHRGRMANRAGAHSR